jgi:hypothetical protein
VDSLYSYAGHVELEAQRVFQAAVAARTDEAKSVELEAQLVFQAEVADRAKAAAGAEVRQVFAESEGKYAAEEVGDVEHPVWVHKAVERLLLCALKLGVEARVTDQPASFIVSVNDIIIAVMPLSNRENFSNDELSAAVEDLYGAKRGLFTCVDGSPRFYELFNGLLIEIAQIAALV